MGKISPLQGLPSTGAGCQWSGSVTIPGGVWKMCRQGTEAPGGLGSVRSTAGLGDLKGHF